MFLSFDSPCTDENLLLKKKLIFDLKLILLTKLRLKIITAAFLITTRTWVYSIFFCSVAHRNIAGQIEPSIDTPLNNTCIYKRNI